MAAAEKNGVRRSGDLMNSKPAPFGTVKFMGADGDEVGIELVDV